jgi:hypothetical protein
MIYSSGRHRHANWMTFICYDPYNFQPDVTILGFGLADLVRLKAFFKSQMAFILRKILTLSHKVLFG